MSDEIHIVFDGPPSHESGRFIEAENEKGEGIRAGEWIQKGNYWHLVIPILRIDIPSLERARDSLGLACRCPDDSGSCEACQASFGLYQIIEDAKKDVDSAGEGR